MRGRGVEEVGHKRCQKWDAATGLVPVLVWVLPSGCHERISEKEVFSGENLGVGS